MHTQLGSIRAKWCPTIMALLFAIGCIVTPASRSEADDEKGGRLYDATGYTLAPQFVQFYDNHGGVPQFGYPISEARVENGYLIQWTERQRLEYHPENKDTDYEVLLGLLGRELTRGFAGPAFTAHEDHASRVVEYNYRLSPELYFPQTGQTVSEPFLSYWQEHGGLPVFGYPISSLFSNDSGLQVQWFERARFEYHPDLPDPYKVLLGHLGLEALHSRSTPYYEMQVFGNPAPDGNLQLGLAQGGESDDPAFLDNARTAASELGPGLVRLDNIFNFYGIVQRGSDGKISYQWSKLDRVLNSVRAMHKEPLICLSYMPETMSAMTGSRIAPPADYTEWANLVSATVTHLNIERKLGIRYWEVWNEPNEWDFWHASYPEYLKLYDVTVQAAISADPSIHIGGPALSRFSTDHISAMLEHEASLGDTGRIDFLSWHSYGDSPAQMSDNIRKAREIAARYPQFKPELFITEFNVLQGGPGDSSANAYTDRVEGAIALMSSLESMQRDRLDQALLFELKDGPGPRPFWGRWGILNYDGQPKPIYHALKAYQTRAGPPLPVSLKGNPGDGKLGLLAFGGPQNASLILWYTGSNPARVKIALPDSFYGLKFKLTLFDAAHNNPAKSGDPVLRPWLKRSAGDLVMDLQPNSLVLLDSR